MRNIGFLIFLFAMAISCSQPNEQDIAMQDKAKALSEKAFVTTMQQHLDAVTNRDLMTLKSTMAPDGTMQLILPATEITTGVKGFMDYHEAWFQDTTWNFKTEILNTEISDNLGMAIVEIVYSEPERDGVPYFNRMHVSYVLKKYDDQWRIIKDHASSVEKSTDKE